MQVHKSKLEVYLEILKALKEKPLTVDKLAYRTNIECTILRKRLDFLIKNELVKEQVMAKRSLCIIEERGIAVLTALNHQKRLEEVKTAIISTSPTIPIALSDMHQNHRNK